VSFAHNPSIGRLFHLAVPISTDISASNSAKTAAATSPPASYASTGPAERLLVFTPTSDLELALQAILPPGRS
jgi:hypothetical protein